MVGLYAGEGTANGNNRELTRIRLEEKFRIPQSVFYV
jgi:hypothetical protein